MDKLNETQFLNVPPFAVLIHVAARAGGQAAFYPIDFLSEILSRSNLK